MSPNLKQIPDLSSSVNLIINFAYSLEVRTGPKARWGKLENGVILPKEKVQIKIRGIRRCRPFSMQIFVMKIIE